MSDDNLEYTIFISDRIDLKLAYLRELIEYDKIVQPTFAQKILIEKKIQLLICNLMDILQIYNDEKLEYKPDEIKGPVKARIVQTIKFLDNLIAYAKIIQSDLVQRTFIELKIKEVIDSIDSDLYRCDTKPIQK